MNTLRVFIGVDRRQYLAYTVAAHSIFTRSSKPVAITPILLSQLPLQRRGLTDFTYARYMVPWLCGYEGHALFVDADILVRGDIAELPWDAPDAVSVVKHDKVFAKGREWSTKFERPAVMLFNCAECKMLTPEYIERATPQKMEWAASVGELDPAWNHLVCYQQPKDAKLAHFTAGIPAFPETEADEYAEEWRNELASAIDTVSWEDIMGASVHAQFKQRRSTAMPLSPFAKAMP
jgi:hypothetical protein